MGHAPVGLLETMRVRERAIPLLGRHLARLSRSLAALDLPPPDRDPAGLVRPFAALGDGVVRLEVRDGRASVTVRELPPAAPPRVITARVHHRPYPHKTTARDVFAHAAAEAARAGADDALLLTAEGFVAEGTTWTVFWWDWEHVCTPELALGVLPGVARGRVAGLVPLAEGRYARGELDGRSLFLANALRGVLAVAALDGVNVPADPRTDELARRFWAG